MSDVGLIGAGVMGAAAGARVLAGGHRVVVCDFAPAPAEWCRKNGARLADTPGQAAREATSILLFLPGPAQIENVITGPDGLIAGGVEGSVIVDHSTSSPEVVRRLASLVENAGGHLLDAPVLGRPSGVGNWALPVGGPVEGLAKCQSILDMYAGKVLHVGPSGSGHTIKLLNQMMFGSINAMTAEMMAIADRLGIAPARVYDIIAASGAGTVSILFKELGRRLADDDFDDPTFSVDLLVKDVRLGIEMATAAGAHPVLGNAVNAINEMAVKTGYGNKDTAVMWKAMAETWRAGGASGNTPTDEPQAVRRG